MSFGLQRLCFKLINNAAKQQQQRIQILPVMIQIDETQTTRASSKYKSKRKQSTDVRRPLAVVRASTMIDRVQRLIGHEFVTAHPPIRGRITVQNIRSNIKNKYTTIAINNDNNDLSGGDGRCESSFLGNTSGIRLNDSNHNNETTYYIDITREYAQISVLSSIESLFEKLGQTVLTSAQIKRFDLKILPNERTNESQSLINHLPSSPPSAVQFRLSHIY
ncbi:unnamed protein product [Adineta steineri]|uniref:Uncharacterized protein n=1 Tax=Adineta steineri TaxID=433720 RepID=A0A819RCC7_9BILA|nr:unnamed protein product [Adineta steineri]CAF4042236.1 unnamed protein product [Adineta steineri]